MNLQIDKETIRNIKFALIAVLIAALVAFLALVGLVAFVLIM